MRLTKVAMVLVTGAMMLNIVGCDLGGILGAQAEDAVYAQLVGVVNSVEATVVGLAPDVLDPVVEGWFDLVENAAAVWVTNAVPGGA